MRRYRLVPLLALALVMTGCASNSGQTPRTVTQIVTATGTPPATTGSTGSTGDTGSSGGGITVVGPSGSGSGSGTATGSASGTGSGSATGTEGAGGTSSSKASSSSSAPPTTKSTPPSKDKKVNPLHAACTSLLDNNDIKKALGATVPSSSSRIVDVANPERKMTGRIKCYYGVKTGSDAHPVAVALAQYQSAGAADAQIGLTVQSEKSLGADASTVKVSGRQAQVLLRDGGLIVLRYDTWTLSVAVEDKLVAKQAKLIDGLQQLATMVLARVLKSG
jgi:hypothetical protein